MSEQGSSQGFAGVNPFELWRQFYEASEQAWTKAVKEVITTQEYAQTQGKVLEMFLAYQKSMRDAMTNELNILNIPTRDDVSRLGELVIGVEEKVDRLIDRLATIQDRLVQPPVDLDEKMSQLLKRLAAMEETLASQVKGAERGNKAPEEAEGAAERAARDQVASTRSGRKAAGPAKNKQAE